MKDFKKVLSYILPYWKNSLFYTITNAFSVIFALFSFTMVIPFLRILFNPDKLVTELKPWSLSSGVVLNNVFYYLSEVIRNSGAVRALLYVSVLVIVASLLKNLFFYLGRYFIVGVKNAVVRDLMRDIYNKIVNLPLGYFSGEKKGNILTRMTSDVQEVKQTVQSIHNMILRDPIAVIFYLGYLLYTSVEMTIFVMIFLPIVGYLIISIAQALKKKSYEAQQILSEVVAETEETVGGLRIIKAFNAEGKMIKKFGKIIEAFYKIMNKVERRIALSNPMSEFLATVVIIVIMYFGGSLILGGKSNLTSETFIAYLVVFSQLINPVKSITNAYYLIQKGLASMRRIDEILTIDESIFEKKDAKPVDKFEREIKLDKVYFSYGDRDVLENINIEIKRGQTIAIVGESGAGKSTLVDLLPRFYDVTKGRILIDGTDIRDLKLKDLRNLFGIVNQQPILFNDTIEYNIAFGVDNYTEEQLIEAAKIANAYDFIMQKPNGFKEIVGEGGSKLSGGQRQRISIARAVMKNPPILILDEATSALDTESEKIVQDALNKLMKNRTSIVIAHRLSTVRNADKIFVLQKGKIIESGTHEELIELNGIYKRLVDMQDLK